MLATAMLGATSEPPLHHLHSLVLQHASEMTQAAFVVTTLATLKCTGKDKVALLAVLLFAFSDFADCCIEN